MGCDYYTEEKEVEVYIILQDYRTGKNYVDIVVTIPPNVKLALEIGGEGLKER